MNTQSWFSIKNIFFLLLILTFLPQLYKSFQHYYKSEFVPHTNVGCITVTALADSTFYVKNINKFLNDPSVKGLLLKIKSPGGLPGTAQTILAELIKFGEKKPIVAHIEDIGASAAYYVSLGAHTIVANSSALVGSIGAKLMKANISKFLEAHNIEVGEISSGKFKTATSFLKEKTPEELAYLQALSDDAYDQFLNDVAHRRNISLADSSVWADGKIFTGRQALQLHLIDKVGSFEEAKQELATSIAQRGVDVKGELKLIYPQQLRGLAKFLYGGDDNNDVETSLSASVASFIVSVYEKCILQSSHKHLVIE